MLKNYFQTALRLLRKNRMYSFINIIGLTAGLWACMVVATVVIDDLSYDKQWSHADNLFRIIMINKMGEGLYDRSPSSFAGLAPELKKNYPEVETYAELYTAELRLNLDEHTSTGVAVTSLQADTNVWKMLDIQPVAGNPRKYVEGTGNMMVSESFAKKFFRAQNPLGKIIYNVPAYEKKPTPYLVTGIIKDIPSNTHLRAEVVVLRKGRTESLNKEQYGSFSLNYILMRPGTDMAAFQQKVNAWYKSFTGQAKSYQFEFQPIRDVYLHADFANQSVKGSIQNIYIFSVVALLLLLIACVNFINLSTARAASRLKETGVRKILGASRRQVIIQFLSEAMLFFTISSLLAILVYQLSLKPVEHYLGHQLAETFLSRISLVAAAVGIILLMSMVTGIYPAWLMSGFKPAGALKGVFNTSSYGQNLLRKGLVVVQFSISVMVLSAMVIVQQQIKFMEHTDVGYNKDNLLSIGSISWDGKARAFKNELMKVPGVTAASLTTWLPTTGAGFMSREVDDPSHTGNKIKFWYINGEPNLAQTLGLRLAKGRLLNSELATDALNDDSLMRIDFKKYEEMSGLRPCLVTSSTAKLLHIGKLNELLNNVKAMPVGIVEDFHNESLKKTMGPLIVTASTSDQYGGMLIRTAPGADKQVMAALQTLWKEFYPEKLLNINWVDELLAKQYAGEVKLQQLFAFFSTLTMLLAALGIFGLIVHAAGQRVKEIGVRKVLGASVFSIVRLLSSDFVKLVLVAILIAAPLGWFFMNKWLEDFAYRITISWWMFAFAGGAALVISLATVSVQSIKAALVNPVKSLRSE